MFFKVSVLLATPPPKPRWIRILCKLKPWPTTQVKASLQKQNLSTDLRRFASRKKPSISRISLVDALMRWCVDALGPNGKNLASTCVEIWTRPKLTQVHASRRKSMQVDVSGWPNKTQVERKSKTCVDLRVRLARALALLQKQWPYLPQNQMRAFCQNRSHQWFGHAFYNNGNI